MIQMPKRSVTRFFIPLIDVLTLLFCIFLLMPIFGEAARDEQEGEAPLVSDTVQQDLEIAHLKRQLQEARQRAKDLGKEPTGADRQELERLRAEVARIREQQQEVLTKTYALFPLYVDGRSGDLFYYNPRDLDRHVVIGTPEKAQALIAGQRRLAGTRRLFFSIQEPLVGGAFNDELYDKYDKWFQSVPHGFEGRRGKSSEGE